MAKRRVGSAAVLSVAYRSLLANASTNRLSADDNDSEDRGSAVRLDGAALTVRFGGAALTARFGGRAFTDRSGTRGVDLVGMRGVDLVGTRGVRCGGCETRGDREDGPAGVRTTARVRLRFAVICWAAAGGTAMAATSIPSRIDCPAESNCLGDKRIIFLPFRCVTSKTDRGKRLAGTGVEKQFAPGQGASGRQDSGAYASFPYVSGRSSGMEARDESACSMHSVPTPLRSGALGTVAPPTVCSAWHRFVLAQKCVCGSTLSLPNVWRAGQTFWKKSLKNRQKREGAG